jgi:hypothetical protein
MYGGPEGWDVNPEDIDVPYIASNDDIIPSDDIDDNDSADLLNDILS